MKNFTFAVIFCALLGLSCSSPVDEGSGSVIYLPSPVVTGLWLIDATGRAKGAWGNPTSPNPAPDSGNEFEFSFSVPVPNPSNEKVVISFNNPSATRIKIFVVRAYLSGVETKDANTIGGGAISKSDHVVVSTLSENVMQAGHFSILYNWTDDKKNPLPAGFYRIYLIRGNKVYWHDALLTRSLDDLPPSLRELYE